MNGKDENGDDDGVDVAQPHERRVQLIEVLLVDVVHETLSSGPRRAAARRGVPWMKYIAQSHLNSRFCKLFSDSSIAALLPCNLQPSQAIGDCTSDFVILSAYNLPFCSLSWDNFDNNVIHGAHRQSRLEMLLSWQLVWCC